MPPGPATFLHEEALSEIRSRLRGIGEEFNSVGIATGLPDFWRSAFPGAQVVPDSDVLAFRPGDLDLAIHALALHWANDPIGQLIQCRRSLRAGGLLLAALLGGSTLTELRTSMASAEAELAGGASPRVAPMGEVRTLGGLVQRAGFAMPVADRVLVDASYGSTLALCRDLRAMGENNALNGRLRCSSAKSLFDRLEHDYRSRFSRQDGTIAATFELIFLTGRAPGGDAALRSAGRSP